LNNKTILITGGSGSFGKAFVNYILKKNKPKKIVIFSRDEQKHFLLQKYWHIHNKKIRYLIGDVRDFDRLNFAMKEVDIVIHAAAMKHVPLGEYNPLEVIKTNIMGAQNVIQAALNNTVNKVIALSTDKASSPVNLYGATKLTSDKLFIAANNYKGKKEIKFSVVRYGNVLGSQGSILPFFLKCKKQNLFPITDKRMTRFNLTLEESVKFVIFSLNKMWGGELFVPKIPSFKILDLAFAISQKPKIKYIGIRPGEKLHEEMISVTESLNTISYKNHFVITPNSEYLHWDKKKYFNNFKGGKYCPNNFSFNSLNNTKYLSVLDLKNIIKKISKNYLNISE
jgi:UDP-N-acetylglucosamine 4,6-dehydratase/5-epimerase